MLVTTQETTYIVYCLSGNFIDIFFTIGGAAGLLLLRLIGSAKKALMQHLVKERNKSVSKDRSSNNVRHITDGFIQAVAVSDQLPTSSQRSALLGPALAEKVAAAKAKWIFKLAKSDVSLRSCDHLSDKFQSMFNDGEIAKQIHFRACLVMVR